MDDISKAFADIKPEDFHRPTSAIDEARMNTPRVGRNMFDHFVHWCVDITYRRASDSLEFNPYAVLTNAYIRRIFLADPDETPSDWAARLRREADDMQATWFYIALLSPGRTYEDERPYTPTTDEGIDAALDSGDLEISVCWLALRDEDGDTTESAGLIKLDEDGKPAERLDGEPDLEGNPFANVLGGQRAH